VSTAHVPEAEVLGASAATRATRAERWIVPGLVLLTIAAFWRVVTCGFVGYDEPVFITENEYVRGGLTLRGLRWAFGVHPPSQYHPLTWLSHMLDCQLFGLWAPGHHLVSLALHACAAVLLDLFLKRATGSVWRSAAVAAFWAVHPLRVESVAWAAERKDVLSALFGFLTLLAYARYAERPDGRRYLAVLGAYALCLLSKPMLVTLPALLLLLDYWPLRRWGPAAEPIPGVVPRRWFPPARLWMEKLPMLAMAAASAYLTLLTQRASGALKPLESYPAGARLANAVVAYAWYLQKLVWPSGLAFFYPFRADWPARRVALSAALLLGVTALAVAQARRRPHLFAGWGFYLVALLPVIGVVQAGGQSFADRYTYVPIIGVLMMLAWSIPAGAARAAIGPAAAALLAFVLATNIQVGYWRTGEALYTRALRVTTGNVVAHNNLGMELLDRGDVRGARDQFIDALKAWPGYALARYNLGNAELRSGDAGRAEDQYRRALALDPGYADAHNNLGLVLAGRGRFDEALEHYGQALDRKPGDANIYFNLGNALADLGRFDAAAEAYQQALALRPGFAEARANMARVNALRQRGEDR
jgi:Tfp pilus assembly protein PilF